MESPDSPSLPLSLRVRRTLEDLALIRQSLREATNQANEPKTESSVVLDLQLAAELKGVVDALGELLWAYISALSAKSGRQPRDVLEWYKWSLL